MTPQQEQTLQELKILIAALVENKFRRGDSEHGGDIQDMTVSELTNNAIDEAIDGLIYLLLAQAKINEPKNKWNLTGLN